MKKGIDVSYYNGTIDFKKVKESGIEFAILRIGYGMYEDQKDKKFEANYNKCVKNKIRVGVYLYSYAKTVDEARREAELCLKWLNNRDLQYPVYFDLEDKSQADLPKLTLNEMCKTFCNTIEKGGYWAGIYTNKYWATTKIDGKELGKRYSYWIAQYNKECTYDGSYAIWQQSSTGRVLGIDGFVDIDYQKEEVGGKINKYSSVSYYDKYNGNSSSIVDALKSIGVDSSFNNRTNIASKNEINNYSGSASQNTQMLNLLKQGKLKK